MNHPDQGPPLPCMEYYAALSRPQPGDDNNGNFICVFKCTIVNLATYRQFTNAA